MSRSEEITILVVVETVKTFTYHPDREHHGENTRLADIGRADAIDLQEGMVTIEELNPISSDLYEATRARVIDWDAFDYENDDYFLGEDY